MNGFRKQPFLKEVFFITVFCFSVFLLVCVFAPEYCGRLGQWFAVKLDNCWGSASFVIPFSLLGFVGSTFCKDTRCWLNGVAIFIVVLCLDVFLSLCWPHQFGQVGYFFGSHLEAVGGKIGAVLFLALFFVSALQSLFEYSLINAIKTSYSEYKNFKDDVYVEPKSMVPVSYMDRPWRNTHVASDPVVLDRTIRSRGIAADIESCLADYGVVGTHVTDQEKGPVITRYYVQLPRGLRSNVVANLDQDIARGLAVASCRVVEQVEGRTEVALELPNEQRETVFFNEIVESNAFRQAQSSVTLVLGKNVSGDPVVGDLSQQMPHVLVAGTTGSGKSMSLQAMILGLMLKSAPNDLRLILIDPKQLEFAHFNGVGHMLMPVITDMHEATNALSWCVSEMERRYSIMRDSGVRDLKGFNQTTEEVLPRIVVVIDEFADLIMANKDVEQLIVRLAQKARACGIHLIVATQRPCSNVITGLIKANISARIALKTASKNDSRIILDQSGAEQLLGQGDMLVSQGSELQRIHGAYVSEDELNLFLSNIRQQYPAPEYIELSQAQVPESDDPQFQSALECIKEKGRASIRLLQSALAIGHPKAARLIEQLEEGGYISKPNESGLRQVFHKNTS